MDPQLPKPSSMELPAPAAEPPMDGAKSKDKGRPAPHESVSKGSDTGEYSLGRGSEQPGSGQPPALSDDPAAPLPAPQDDASGTPPVPHDPALTVPVGANPAMADDSDLIEKEWVMKAKYIVEQTKNDPHEQNKAVNRVKADYLKKRYQKDIKLNDE